MLESWEAERSTNGGKASTMTKIATRVKVSKVTDKLIPMWVSFYNRIAQLKTTQKEQTKDQKGIKDLLLGKYKTPGIYQDKKTGEAIVIGPKTSTSKGYKDVVDGIKNFISLELKTSDKTRKACLDKIESLMGEHVGVTTEKAEVFPYEEEE